MGSIKSQAQQQLGLLLPWMSWLTDTVEPNSAGVGVKRCRVYAHQLDESTPPVTLSDDAESFAWMSAKDIADLQADGLLEETALPQWLHMWQHQEDESGLAVTRSIGVPTTDVQYFRYNGNGNVPGHYRVGDFDAEGHPVADTAKVV